MPITFHSQEWVSAIWEDTWMEQAVLWRKRLGEPCDCREAGQMGLWSPGPRHPSPGALSRDNYWLLLQSRFFLCPLRFWSLPVKPLHAAVSRL